MPDLSGTTGLAGGVFGSGSAFPDASTYAPSGVVVAEVFSERLLVLSTIPGTSFILFKFERVVVL